MRTSASSIDTALVDLPLLSSMLMTLPASDGLTTACSMLLLGTYVPGSIGGRLRIDRGESCAVLEGAC